VHAAAAGLRHERLRFAVVFDRLGPRFSAELAFSDVDVDHCDARHLAGHESDIGGWCRRTKPLLHFRKVAARFLQSSLHARMLACVATGLVATAAVAL